MTVPTLTHFQKELKLSDGKRWFCKTCNENVTKRMSVGTPSATNNKREYTLSDVMSKLESIENKYADILNKFEEQQAINAELRVEIQNLKSKLTATGTGGQAQESAQEPRHDPILEINEREYRRRNLMVFSAGECKSNNSDEKQEADRCLARKIIEVACPRVKMEDVRVFRIGSERPGKTRPLKIRFPEISNVRDVIHNIPMLRSDAALTNLAFSYDKTPAQVKEYKDLKAELTRRMQEGEADLKIKYFGSIPKIVKSKN